MPQYTWELRKCSSEDFVAEVCSSNEPIETKSHTKAKRIAEQQAMIFKRLKYEYGWGKYKEARNLVYRLPHQANRSDGITNYPWWLLTIKQVPDDITDYTEPPQIDSEGSTI